jgi:hypothetical protein
VRLPTQRSVYASTNQTTPVAQDNWAYDNYGSGNSSLVSAPGIAGHNDTGFGQSLTARGNVTSHSVLGGGTEYFYYDTTGVPVRIAIFGLIPS